MYSFSPTLLLLFFFMSFSSYSQTFTESFETDGEGTRYESNNFTVGCGTDWFRRTQDAHCGTASHNFRDLANNNASNEDGIWYFGGSDVEEAGGGENPLGDGEAAYLVMATEDVTGFNSFTLSIKLAGIDTDAGAFEGEETILIEYAFDSNIATGANCNGCLPIESNVNSGTYSIAGRFLGNTAMERYQEDTNLDNSPDGAILTGTFADFSYTFTSPGSPSNLSIRIRLQHTASVEDAAFDHLRLTSTTLPVEMVDFSASPKEDKVLLEWTTASEVNNDYFEIYHSSDGLNFDPISKIDGQGTSQSFENYEYTHESAVAGINYYKIKQVDFDGSFDFSKVVVAKLRSLDFATNWTPNPFETSIHLNLDEAFDQNTPIEIFDLRGALVYSGLLERGQTQKTLNLNTLPSGVFIIVLKNKHVSTSHKIVKLD